MKRTTIFMDERLERELRAVAQRAGRPMAALVREAVEQYVATARQDRGRLGFIAAGRSGRNDVAERHEELLFAGNTAPRHAARKKPRRAR